MAPNLTQDTKSPRRPRNDLRAPKSKSPATRCCALCDTLLRGGILDYCPNIPPRSRLSLVKRPNGFVAPLVLPPLSRMAARSPGPSSKWRTFKRTMAYLRDWRTRIINGVCACVIRYQVFGATAMVINCFPDTCEIFQNVRPSAGLARQGARLSRSSSEARQSTS